MMKRWSLIALLLALLLVAGTALAYDNNTSGVDNLPMEVEALLSTSRWAGWEVTGWVNPAGLHQEHRQAAAFAAVKHGRSNDLLAFCWSEGGWDYLWHNADALPQVEAPVILAEASENITAFASYYLVNEEIQEHKCLWQWQKDGSWRLYWFATYDPLMFIDVSSDGLHLSNVGWVSGKETDVRVYGDVQNDLRYFSLRAFPTTVKAAQSKLTQAPELPVGTLSAQKIKFTSGKKYKVYQGPGEDYGQAGNGKAVVSTNDWIQVFGRENGWIMIQYDITGTHMRIGWITEKALPKKADVPALRFTPTAATVAFAAELTDDPLFSGTAIQSLPEGQAVSYLATLGDWAYVEASAGEPVRGFLPAAALRTGRVFMLENYPTADGSARLSGTLTVDANGILQVAIDASAWPDAQLSSFNLYDELTGSLICEALNTAPAQFTAAVLTDASAVLICPVYADGTEQRGKAVSVQW